MTARASLTQRRTRIQAENEDKILKAALRVFSEKGYRGASLDDIAAGAGMSKPNMLYYFQGKEEIHHQLLSRLLEDWLAPLKTIDPEGDPLEEIGRYIRLKLRMARDYPNESRLFANEILRGAPHIEGYLESTLKPLVDSQAAIISRWIEEGRLAPVEPRHLIFAIWATTQHYADFDAQVSAVLGEDDARRFEDAEATVTRLILGGLTPNAAN